MLTGEVQSDQALGHVAVVALLGFTQLDSGCLTPSQGLLEPPFYWHPEQQGLQSGC
jgi:hypothetical protein